MLRLGEAKRDFVQVLESAVDGLPRPIRCADGRRNVYATLSENPGEPCQFKQAGGNLIGKWVDHLAHHGLTKTGSPGVVGDDNLQNKRSK